MSQQPLSLAIKDKITFEPIAGATVIFLSQDRQLIADNYGKLAISSYGSAAARIIVSAAGYASDTVDLNPLAPKAIIYLRSQDGSLGEVVVTGSMRQVQRSASPVPVEVYSPKFFMKNPSPSIFDALQMVNGIRPQLNCNVCSTGDIHINGLEGPYTMVLIDGMPIVSSLASVYGLSGIPNSLVERIEVVKGPASSLYGSEAIGGLINVITKNPLKAPLVSLDISGTSWQEYNTDIGLKYQPGKNITALLGINYFRFGKPTDKNKDNFTDVTLQDRISLFNKLSWKRKDNRVANLAVRYVYEDRWGGEMNWNKNFRGGDSIYGESIYTSRVELIGNYQLPLKEKISFSYSANQHDQHSAYGTTIFNARQQVVFGQLNWIKELGRSHSLLTGAVARYSFYDDNTPVTSNAGTLENQPDKIVLPGLFVQDEIILNKRQRLLLGLRYDYDKRHGHIYTPRLAYKFSATENDIIRLNAGSGFRVVNIFTEDHAALTGARTVVIRDELKPERSYNVNLNYLKRIHTPNYWMSLDLSAWYTYFTNRILPDYTTNSNQIIYDNLKGYSISNGVSLNMELSFINSLKVTAGATLMNVSINKKINGKSVREQQLLTERWTGVWSVSYTIPKTGLAVDYTGNIYGPMLLPVLSAIDPRSSRSPVWSIQNIQLSKKIFPSFEVYAGIKNLLDWTPAKRASFIIARADDPFDKRVIFSPTGEALSSPDNPYALTFDPNYVYAPNQGIRAFWGIRYTIVK